MLTEYDVFLSYSHHDIDWVKDWLLPRLELAGLKACVDFRDFKVGVPSIVNMENAVKKSRKIILVMTPNWTLSEWTDFESLLAQGRDPAGRRGRIVPILLKASDLPDRLAIFTYADFTNADEWDPQLARVIDAIREPPASPSTKLSTQLAPNLVHPYPLQANFTGRAQEREDLTAWLADNEHPIYELVAMGGMGKSALTWYWLTRDVTPSTDIKLDGVMWWSFYEGQSSFARFIDEALKYVGGQSINAERFPTSYDRAQELRRLLQHKRVLFVLDGFERQLRDYASLDAVYQTDDIHERPIEDRACVDPITARFVRNIAAGMTQGRILITTRLPVSDLEDRAGDELAGVLRKKLQQLARADAVAFMHVQGVTKGTDAEIANICEAYGYHPLSLRLLSGLIEADTKMPGDIRAAPRHDVHEDLVQRQHHILEQSYNALDKRERALLSRIAAFRSRVTYDALSIFNTFENEEGFEKTLSDLRVRGLLQRDMASNRYDLHPIVRYYAYERLTEKVAIHEQLRDYFARIPKPNLESVQSIEDLASVVERYYHTARAERYYEAAELLRDVLVDALYFRLGAYQTAIELVRALFPDGVDHLPRLDDKAAQGWTLNTLANVYGVSGQPRLAVPLYKQDQSLRQGQGDKGNLAIGLMSSASGAYFLLGEFATMEKNLRRSLELCREIGDEFWEAGSYLDLGRLFAYRGEFDEALRNWDIALNFERWQANPQAVGVTWSYRAICALLMGDTLNALAAAGKARRLADDRHFERDIIRAEWLLGTALVMEGKDLNLASNHLTEALTRCRRTNLVELEPDILLALARWHRAKVNLQEAIAYADEALVIADRSEYRLAQADLHNFLALLALDAGDREKARKEAEIGKERAWCDGPPHCYKPALDEAEKMLKEVGTT